MHGSSSVVSRNLPLLPPMGRRAIRDAIRALNLASRSATPELPFRYLPDIALADIAFEAESDSLEGLFESSAEALTDIMVDPKTLRSGSRATATKKLSITSDDLDTLLYDFLTEIIIVKDVESLLFSCVKVDLASDHRSLNATLKGEPIDRQRQTLRNDVKAVTMHLFGVKKEAGLWKATVVLDI